MKRRSILPLVVGALSLLPAAVFAAAAKTTIPNPVAATDAQALILQIIKYILGTVGILATFMFVWGGYLMITAAGSADQIKKAKETLTWASIGIIVILLSYYIILFIVQGIVGSST